MTEEREKATFDVRELTYFLDGGEKFTQVRRGIKSIYGEKDEFYGPSGILIPFFSPLQL